MEGENNRNMDQLGGKNRSGEGPEGVLWEYTEDDGEETEVIKNENGEILRTTEELERAFRRRLEKTFYISEEENEYFARRPRER